MLLTILVFLLILSVIVLIHELGHFFVAKKLGIKVEEFGFGFPPRVFGIKRGETVYSINWLPIGGFVKLYGEDEAGGGKLKVQSTKLKVTDEKRAFFARSIPQRAAVVVAGIVMNVLLAIVIFYLFLTASGFKTELPLLGNFRFFGVNQSEKTEIIISAVSKNSPAQNAGLAPYSQIVSLNGEKITDASLLTRIINANKGKEIEVSWQDPKTKKISTASLTPRVFPPPKEGAIGIAFFGVKTAVLSYDTLPQKIASGVIHPANLLVYNLSIMVKLIGISFEEKTLVPVSEGVSGPIGIYSLVATILKIPSMKESVLQILHLAGILSISLAFFNILPIPALDGGRLFFIGMEVALGKKISRRIEGHAHAVGMVILLTLILLITFKDITRIMRGGISP